MPKIDKYIYILIAIFLLRLIASMTMGLMPQDAYYYFYSEVMDWSYFDHPPMVAYMLRAYTAILGKHELVIKLADFCTTLFTFYGFYYLSRLFLTKENSIKSTILFGSTILLTLLSINTTPDVPLMLMWVWSLVILYKAIFEKKPIYWILSGIMMGLAFDSKYTALFLPFGLFVFLVFSKKHRHYLFSVNILLAAVFFLLTVFPVYWWNVQHDWISFKFQSSSRAEKILDFVWQPKLLLGNIGTQMALLIPVLFITVFTVLYKYIKRALLKWRMPQDNYLFLLSFSVPIIGFFFSLSVFYWVKLNWIMPGYMTAIILSGIYIKKRWLNVQLALSIIFHLIIIFQFVFNPFPIKSDDTYLGWKSFSEEVNILHEEYPDYFLFSDDNYKTSAMLRFYTEKDVYSGNILNKNGLQFNIRYPELNHLKGMNALFFDSDPPLSHLKKKGKHPHKLDYYFERIIQLDPIIIRNNKEEPIRKFFVYKCMEYRGIKDKK